MQRLGLLALVLLAALACQRETPDVSQNGPSKSSTAAEPMPEQTSTLANPMSPQSDTPERAAKPAPPTPEVHLIEYAVHMPETLPAGKVAFNIENGGKEQHGFAIEGTSVNSGPISPGSTAAAEATLTPGTYVMYCPVKGHKEKGMSKTVTVK